MTFCLLVLMGSPKDYNWYVIFSPITLIKIKMLKHLSITYVDSFLFIRSPFVGRLRNSAWSVVLLLRGGREAEEQGPHAARNMEFIMWSNKQQPTEQRPTDDRERERERERATLILTLSSPQKQRRQNAAQLVRLSHSDTIPTPKPTGFSGAGVPYQ